MRADQSWTAAGVGPAIASLFFIIYAMAWKYQLPFALIVYIAAAFRKLISLLNRNDQIIIHEYSDENMLRNDLYTAAQAYLASTSSSYAHKLKAEVGRGSNIPVVSIEDDEEVQDTTFRSGIKVWWNPVKETSKTIDFSHRQLERKYV
jgi:Domain associated at C-terminal with AAA